MLFRSGPCSLPVGGNAVVPHGSAERRPTITGSWSRGRARLRRAERDRWRPLFSSRRGKRRRSSRLRRASPYQYWFMVLWSLTAPQSVALPLLVHGLVVPHGSAERRPTNIGSWSCGRARRRRAERGIASVENTLNRSPPTGPPLQVALPPGNRTVPRGKRCA